MADLAWKPQSPLRSVLMPGRSGAAVEPAGVRMQELDGYSLMLVMARRGRGAAMADVARAHFGVDVPAPSSAVSARDATLVWAGPDQFLVLSPQDGVAPEPAKALATAFGDTASVSDQSHGRVLIGLAGRNARDVLAKVSSIDFDPAVFPVGGAAATSIDHTNALIWRAPDERGEPAYRLLVFATFADSLWRLLADSAAEFGLETGVSRLA